MWRCTHLRGRVSGTLPRRQPARVLKGSRKQQLQQGSQMGLSDEPADDDIANALFGALDEDVLRVGSMLSEVSE